MSSARLIPPAAGNANPPLAWRGEFPGVLLIAAQVFWLLVTLVLLTRRIAGGMETPLSGSLFLLVAVASVGLAWGLRLLGQSSSALGHPALLAIAASLTQLLLLSTLSLVGTPIWGLMLGWLLFLASEAGWWWSLYNRTLVQTSPPPSAPTTAPAEPTSLPNVIQQLTRARADHGESIIGILRADFAAGQRLAVLHVAFCPPLEAVPEVSLEVQEGPDAVLKATLIQSFGLRMEVRLEDTPDESCSVTARFVATVGEVTPAL